MEQPAYNSELSSFYVTAPLLTRREVEIMELMARGNSSKQMAAHLHISYQTVNKHVKNIYHKIGAHNKIDALNKTKWLMAFPPATNTYC